MAEVAATAIGIAGVVGVLQSLLQCYKDFLTARDFADDYAILQVRTALLENSTTTWAVSVGLIDESGAPLNKFLVAFPTEKNAKLVETALTLIRKQLDAANNELSIYTIDEENTGALAVSTEVANPKDTPSKMKRVANKLHRMAHRQHDAQHPGTLKRTEWALVSKERLEGTLNTVTTLVDRLNTDFAPVDQKTQLDKYCEDFKSLKLDDDELREVEKIAGDILSQKLLKMLENERLTGNRFKEMSITKEGMVVIGDHYDENWKGQGVSRQPARNDHFEQMSVTDQAFVSIGDTFGGKSPVQIRLEQMAARKAQGGGSGN